MDKKRSVWRCDRCGYPMVEWNCKVTCVNCGQRWDCSDLTIWLDNGRPGRDRSDHQRETRDSRERQDN